jgi:hypothetical protein
MYASICKVSLKHTTPYTVVKHTYMGSKKEVELLSL